MHADKVLRRIYEYIPYYTGNYSFLLLVYIWCIMGPQFHTTNALMCRLREMISHWEIIISPQTRQRKREKSIIGQK